MDHPLMQISWDLTYTSTMHTATSLKNISILHSKRPNSIYFVQVVALQVQSRARTPANVRVTTLAHQIWRQVLREGDTAIDATCGRGSDSLWLANAVGPKGTVYAFDIQVRNLASSGILQGWQGLVVAPGCRSKHSRAALASCRRAKLNL